jgi:hypothetical protein
MVRIRRLASTMLRDSALDAPRYAPFITDLVQTTLDYLVGLAADRPVEDSTPDGVALRLGAYRLTRNVPARGRGRDRRRRSRRAAGS